MVGWLIEEPGGFVIILQLGYRLAAGEGGHCTVFLTPQQKGSGPSKVPSPLKHPLNQPASQPSSLPPPQVLLSSSGRVRLGCCGVPEVLASEAGGLPPPGGPEAAALQRQDLVALGNLLLVLACAGRGAAPSLEYVTAHFSRELCHIVAGLLAASEGAGKGVGWGWGWEGSLRLSVCLSVTRGGVGAG